MLLQSKNFTGNIAQYDSIYLVDPHFEYSSYLLNFKTRTMISCDFFRTLTFLLPTFRRKVGFGFARGSTVEVGSKFSGRFEVKGLQKKTIFIDSYIYIYMYIHHTL